jgi:hypothetical protein
MQNRRVLNKVDKLLVEYLDKRFEYYRQKLVTNRSLNDIIRESVSYNDLPILRHLIIEEFPQYQTHLFKYLIIQ